VPISDRQLQTDPAIRLRCPHCKHVFERQDKGRCPACEQIILIPPAARKNAAAMRDRCVRLSRERRERLGRMQQGGSLLGTRRMRRTLALVAFAVLGVLLPLNHMLRKHGGVPRFLNYDDRTRQSLGVLRFKLECFRRDCGRYPTEQEGLWALALNPGVTNWRGPYLTKIPPDLWRRRYIYSETNGAITLWSAGPDAIPHTADDLDAPLPDMAAVAADATNPPPVQTDEPVIEIITSDRAHQLIQMAAPTTPPPAALSGAPPVQAFPPGAE
jgi:type II secretion system protein G